MGRNRRADSGARQRAGAVLPGPRPKPFVRRSTVAAIRSNISRSTSPTSWPIGSASSPGPLTRGVATNWSPPTSKVLRDKNRSLPQPRLSSKTPSKAKKGDVDLTGHALSTDEQLALAEIVLPAAAREHIAKLDPRTRDRRSRRGDRSIAARSRCCCRPSRPGICSTIFRPSPTLPRRRSWRCSPAGGPAAPMAMPRC